MTGKALLIGTILLCGASAAVGADTATTIEIVDETGHPVRGAEVRIELEDGEWRVATTDDRGRARFRDLRPGRYRVEVDAGEFRSRVSMLEVGSAGHPWVIELRRRFVQRVVVTSSLPELVAEERITAGTLRETGRSDLAESMIAQPSLDATRRGAINLDPQVRGLQETQVGMFVDGTRTFAAGPGRMDSELSHVDLHAVSEVRAIRGPYALTWGAGTLSALRVETYRPDFSTGGLQSEGQLGFGYGTNAERGDTHFRYGGASERLRFNLFAGYREGSDYRDGSGRTIPGNYASGNLRWIVGLRTGRGLTLDYSGGYQEQRDVDYPGRMLDATYFFTRSHALDVEWAPADRRYRVTGRVYLNAKDHLMDNDGKPSAQPDPGRMPPFATRVDVPTESNTRGGQLGVSLDRGKLQWILGTDFYFLEQNAVRTISRRDTGMTINVVNAWPDARIDDQGIYVQLIRAGDKTRVGGTLRIDFVQASADENLVSRFFLDNTTGELGQNETNVSAAVSGAVAVSPRWEVSAGLGRAVRTANSLERYADRFPYSKFQIAAEFVGSPDIRPEKSLEVDLDATGRVGPLSLSAGVFYRLIDDYITVVPDPSLSTMMPMSFPVVYRHVNGDEARFAGGELRLGHSATKRLSWRASLSYVWGEDTLFDEPVFGIPPLQGELGVRYGFGSRRPVWIEASGLFVDRQGRVAESRLEIPTPGYSVFAVRAGVQLTDSLGLSAAVENLTDEQYSRHLNSLDPFTRERVPEIGRYLRAGLSYVF